MDEYDGDYDAGWREAMRQLRARVWEVRSPDDLNRFLLRMRQSIEGELSGLVAWRLFRIEEKKQAVDWSVHALTPDSYWLKLGKAVPVEDLLVVWRTGLIVQRPVRGGNEAEEVGKLLGRGAASICQIPFEQGVLVLYGRVGANVPDEWSEDIREICRNLFCRIFDIKRRNVKWLTLFRCLAFVYRFLILVFSYFVDSFFNLIIATISIIINRRRLSFIFC